MELMREPSLEVQNGFVQVRRRADQQKRNGVTKGGVRMGMVSRWVFLGVFVLFLKIMSFFPSSGADKILDSSIEDHPLNEQDSIQKSPLSETLDVKPSDVTLPLTLPLGAEDHHLLLPVADSQPPAPDALLRPAANGYSEPQLIFLQQLYWLCEEYGIAKTSLVVNINIAGKVHIFILNWPFIWVVTIILIHQSKSTWCCIIAAMLVLMFGFYV